MSDILLIPEFRAAYIVTDEFTLHEVKFLYQNDVMMEVQVNINNGFIDLKPILA